ncbi:hypothetical protein LTR70_001603 [Exophiala xenobiotica]|uniref:Uncharacterized protein n=1 Tax=Lithohypha guttulata TaxID=1690604 RepID=A0ABR0K6W4_9EURO|nr:hypothetical protein LTR24_006154 [Lithohypha guttulata]KAK5327129.1 hypothetical protein LTR70_001603 [Exophiala xenobiotica]
MPSPSGDSQSFSGPYTPTKDINSASFAAIASGMSADKPFPASAPPDSIQESLASKFGTSNAAVSALASASQTQPQSTTLETITSSAASSTPTNPAAASSAITSQQSISASPASAASTPLASASSNAGSSTAATASSAANNSSNDLHAQASTMSSPGMQAAVAVPVVVVVLAALGLIFFCMRRRRKRREVTEGTIEKTPAAVAASKKRNWTRHFRMFSFDTELLMGGRYSSTNSIRSRQTGSLRSANRSQHSEAPSMHSIDEVAPPYRDAINSAQPPSISQVIAGGAAGGAAAVAGAGVNRSASNATAPPPYGAAAGRLEVPSPTTPASQRSNRNPFADSPPISPVEGSPFNDPPGTSPPISRNSSVYASTIGGVSDAASIREATLARNASVMSGGRIINNVGDRAS